MPIDYAALEKSLLASELLTGEQLAAAKAKAQQRRVTLEQTLVDSEYVGEDALGQLVADGCGLPYVNLRTREIDENVLRLIPELVARRQQIVAYDRGPDGIRVATATPDNTEQFHFLEKKTGERVIPHYTMWGSLDHAFALYRRGLQAEFTDIIKESAAASLQTSGEDKQLPITKIVDTVFSYAYHNKASDVHIEPHDEAVVVRFRIDGILHDVISISKELHPYLITRIKILAKLRTDEHRSAQDGRLEFTTDGTKVDVRVSIIPVADGEKAVLRLLAERSRQYNLTELGLSERDRAIVEKGFHKPYGMVLATGPTGSGKTTTLYAILKMINSREVNISTIEDPVEYEMEGVNQIQVNSKTNLTFANGLRSILRQDPDVIMVGEIRDEETAGIAINSAMTGHLVLSTLHTNDAPTTLPRLLDMKIEPFLIATTVNVAVAQRLVRKIHSRCRESFIPTKAEQAIYEEMIGREQATRIGLSQKGFRLYRGQGCSLCNHTGYEGRIGIFEVLEVTEPIRQLIMQRADSGKIREAAISQGMTTMLDDGLHKAVQGMTTIEEVMRVTRS